MPFDQIPETILLSGNDTGDNRLVVFIGSRGITRGRRIPAASGRAVSGYTLLFGHRIARDNRIPRGPVTAR
jgi:hypothetical protein